MPILKFFLAYIKFQARTIAVHQPCVTSLQYSNDTVRYRYAWKKERDNVRLLPRTVRGHHVYHKD